MKYDVTLLTDPRYDQPANPDWYQAQILIEDGFVIEALESAGLKVNRISWDRTDFDWSNTKLAVFRTTWDYFDRFDAFSAWLHETAKKTHFLNPYQLITWNINKRYLMDLKARGIPIPETEILEQGTNFDLNTAFDRWQSAELVIKPCIAGAARNTYRVSRENQVSCQAILDGLLQQESMLVQPFLTNILEEGEISVLVFGGVVSHAVQKIAKAGDYRVQDDFGGTVYTYEATPDEIKLAEAAVRACSIMPAYARVDIIKDNNGQSCVSELELIEPELFFRFNPNAAKLLANEIKQALDVN